MYCNFQDEDASNSRMAYVSTSGTFVTVSTKLRKHSIKEKNNNNVLDRFMKIKVKSYGYKYDFTDDDNDKKKQRMINKSKKQQLGLILEELYDIFPNCCSFYNNSLNDDLIDDDNIKNKKVTYKEKNKIEDVEDIKNMGIDYNRVLLYTIMSVQDLNKKLDNENKLLKDKYNDLENKFNLLLNKLNLTI